MNTNRIHKFFLLLASVIIDSNEIENGIIDIMMDERDARKKDKIDNN